MENILNDVLDFLEENGAASMADLVDALDSSKEEIRESIRMEGRLDSRLAWDKKNALYTLA